MLLNQIDKLYINMCERQLAEFDVPENSYMKI